MSIRVCVASRVATVARVDERVAGRNLDFGGFFLLDDFLVKRIY